MIKPDTTIELTKKAIENFEKVRESIKGLYDILKINFSEHDIYFKMAQDNIIGLYQNFLELMLLDDNCAKQFKTRLQNAEIRADLPMNKFLNGKR
ncbi:MAG: hypothetical protein ACFFAN_07910 [Promethearchaeota archaeon]